MGMIGATLTMVLVGSLARMDGVDELREREETDCNDGKDAQSFGNPVAMGRQSVGKNVNEESGARTDDDRLGGETDEGPGLFSA